MVETTQIFDHERHQTLVAEDEGLGGAFPENQSCVQCHTSGEAKTAENAKSCLECHEEDTGWSSVGEATADLARAVSYLEAMHGTCSDCHKKEAAKQARPELRECSTCHESLGPSPPPVGLVAAGNDN
jgi:hypothetical protein